MIWSRTVINWSCLVGTLVAVPALLTGCGKNATATIPMSLAIQQQLIVDQQPANISSLKSWYAKLAESASASQQPAESQPAESQTVESKAVQSEPAESQAAVSQSAEQQTSQQFVTVAGRIYAQGMSPFDAKESVFTIMELPKPGHNHEDPGDCPFCLRELKNAKIAIVRVVDPSGKTYPQPADQLLGLAKSQDIVVQGNASQVGDTLVIELQKLHLLNEDAAAQLSQEFSSQ